MKGKCKKIDRESGIGFIESENGFMYGFDIDKPANKSVKPNDIVEFDPVHIAYTNDKMATEIKIIDSEN
jgi:cold shock CspA family protein